MTTDPHALASAPQPAAPAQASAIAGDALQGRSVVDFDDMCGHLSDICEILGQHSLSGEQIVEAVKAQKAQLATAEATITGLREALEHCSNLWNDWLLSKDKHFETWLSRNSIRLEVGTALSEAYDAKQAAAAEGAQKPTDGA